MFEKVLSRIGIHSATVDTKLYKDYIVQGGYLEGMVEIKGGNTAQRIQDIYLKVMTNLVREEDGKEYEVPTEIFRHQLNDPFVIEANGQEEFHFKFHVPIDVPFTKEGSNVWLNTGLDIEKAVDPTDKDRFKILMHPYTANLFETLEEMGFVYEEVKNVEDLDYPTNTGLLQRVVFTPTTEEYQGIVESVTVWLAPKFTHWVTAMFDVKEVNPSLAEVLQEAVDEVLESEEGLMELEITEENAQEIKPILEEMFKGKLYLKEG